MSRLGVVALWLLLSAGCAKKEVRPDGGSPAGRSAVLFVSADLKGYLAPCGCSESMRGGIARAAHLLEEARRAGKPVLYVDGGDSLFGQLRIDEAAVPQQERKARALAEAFKRMGLATRAVGELDDARGEQFRRGLGLPDQAEPLRLFELGGRKVAVVVAGGPEGLVARVAEARERGASFVLVLLHQGFAEAQKAAALPGLAADLIVAGHSAGELDAEENRLARGEVPVARLQSKGRSLLRLDLVFGGGADKLELLEGQAELERELSALDGRIELLRAQVNEPSLGAEAIRLRKQKLEELFARRKALAERPPPSLEGRSGFSARFVPLESSFPSLPEVKAVVAEYDREVGKLNLEWAKAHGKDCPPPEKGGPAFVGSAACRECHEAAFPVWEASKHAHAYETLEREGKQFHLDCVGCHVTGADRAGGVCRVDKVEGRKGVGCESCHGPGSLHVEDPSRDNVTVRFEARHCVGCHDPENSPHFEYPRYLKSVLGPGHGATGPK